MDSSNQLDAFDALVLELGKIDFRQKRIKGSFEGENGTNCSKIDDDDKRLSHVEESTIDSPNAKEGSVSDVDLNIFDDLHVHRTRKTRREQRLNMGSGENSTDYDSSNESGGEVYGRSGLTENSLNNSMSIDSQADTDQTDLVREIIVLQESILRRQESVLRRQEKLIDSLTKYSDLSSKQDKTVVRRKRKKPLTIRKNDKSHIYSFFSAMADLVSTFPDEEVITVKQNVNIILEQMVVKMKEWFNNEDQTNPARLSYHDQDIDYSLIQDKLVKLKDIN